MRLALVCLVAAACGSGAHQRVTDHPAAAPKPPTSNPRPGAYLTGSRIVATADGAVIADEDSGNLLTLDGRSLAIGRGLGQVVYDPDAGRVFVADRRGDRIAVVDVATFKLVASYPTPVEPFAVALTPDRKTLLVTTMTDRALVAFDAATGSEQWRSAIAPRSRGIAVSPAGAFALVASTATTGLQIVELTGAHRVAEIPYDLSCESCDASKAFTRGTGAVQFIDARRAVATFQRSIPQALINVRTDRYSGGSNPPITQHVAFFTVLESSADETVAQLADNQPRSLAWDPVHATLYVAGHGSDTLLELPQLSTLTTDNLATAEANASSAVMHATDRCGPDGIAIAANGTVLLWCAFTRSVMQLAKPSDLSTAELRTSPSLAASAFTPEQQRGHILFEGTNRDINADNTLACTTCHVEGLSDGLSWRVSEQALQTPVLAGRLAGTAPYRWDGSAPTLEASIASTVHRLGGFGLSTTDTAAMIAFLQALPRPRVPTVRDPAAVARGKALFAGQAGCASCHQGAAYADGELHAFQSSLPHADTPSLVGLSGSAPYYHDGSAETLHDLLHGKGGVWKMSEDLAQLSEPQLADLEAFLETL